MVGKKLLKRSLLCATAFLAIYNFSKNVNTRVKNDFYSNWKTLYNHDEERGRHYHEFQPIIENGSNNYVNPGNNPPPPLILIWTKYFGASPLIIFEGFSPTWCPNVCEYTEDRGRFQDSNAVLFHASNVHAVDNPIALQLLRPRHQIWIYNNLESPSNMDQGAAGVLKSDPIFSSSFNWTMTYRRDSDVYHPYAKIITEIPSSYSLHLQKDKLHSKIRNKTHKVVWPVSHCYTQSRREELVAELQSFDLQIDIVGNCGVSWRDRAASCRRKGRNYETCFAQFEEKYKFVLALENSLCLDYITEKLFNALNFYIVPILYNGGSGSERGGLSSLLPPGSYIDVKDFAGGEQLADYLHYLDQNEEEYVKYFEWKGRYRVQPRGEESWCDLCAKMYQHKKNMDGGDSGQVLQYYPDVAEWYENVYEEGTRRRRTGQGSCVNKDKIVFRNKWALFKNIW